jgi:hypothetical protein
MRGHRFFEVFGVQSVPQFEDFEPSTVSAIGLCADHNEFQKSGGTHLRPAAFFIDLCIT